ncbi:hypothetical protein B0H13DRAFT_1951935 [Mycena leptocephala]|nr:hypothetical protein B0H13DRAFT_1951935 [Mycena leptocephala]
MTETEPPSYDGFGFEALISSSHGAPSDLPVYTRRPTPPPIVSQVEREPKEFLYHIKNRSGNPWATLTVQGDPRLTKLIPTITQGSNLNGSVQLSLRSPEAIQAVCILVKGEIISGAPTAVPITFLETKHTLWSIAEGDPLAPENSENSGKSIVKLKGDYGWPYSIPLPTTVEKKGETFLLPHTFMDRLASFSVRYTAELRIVRGKLRTDDKVTCTFAYFSMRQPDSPSPLRQLAYQENSPLFGPEADPEGWHSQTSSVKGTVFASRMIDVKFTLSLANPLSYTRTASIPCAITIETKDLQALDLLSSPSASMVYLERTVYESKEAWRNTVEPCGQALFWPSTEGAPESSSFRRHLMGEIHLKANLQPSSSMLGFAVEYSVVVFPFQAAAFKPLNNSPFLRQTVEITTRYAPGPRQKTYTPPTYEIRNVIIDHYYYSMVIESVVGRSGRGRGGR